MYVKYLSGLKQPIIVRNKKTMKPIETLVITADQDQWPAWKLTNSKGASVTILSWGACVVDIFVPDHEGNLNDVVLGFRHPNDYRVNDSKLGCVVGPYANRINRGQFFLNKEKIQLGCNSDGHHLHGGNQGLHCQQWKLLRSQQDAEKATLELHCYLDKTISGYPASYDITVRYTWNNHCELRIEYYAKVTDDTIINLTQHSYFNLAGVENIDRITNHQLWVNSSKVCGVDSAMIPTGKYQSTANTSLDFSSLTTISERWNLNDPVLKKAQGIDHNWIFDSPKESTQLVAAIYEPNSQRHLKVFSDQPGLQVYSGNFLDQVAGKYQQNYNAHTGLCLETQHYPDSPNHSEFPNVFLNKGETFTSTTVYQFGVSKPACNADASLPIPY